jgi:hypothetical protein
MTAEEINDFFCGDVLIFFGLRILGIFFGLFISIEGFEMLRLEVLVVWI